MLNIHMYYTPPFNPVNLQQSSCKGVFSIRVENSVDPDQMASSEAVWSGSALFLKRIYPSSAGQGLKQLHAVLQKKTFMQNIHLVLSQNMIKCNKWHLTQVKPKWNKLKLF